MHRAWLWVCILSLVSLFSWHFPKEASEVSLVVSVSRQELLVFSGSRVHRTFPVSTSKFGTGSIKGSYQTPLGKHRIREKIGDGAPLGTVFRAREPNSEVYDLSRSAPLKGDYVLTRILWLSGLEEGKNQGGEVDSFERYIYIHGTHEENLIGKPASRGCIRMVNQDVVDLFTMVQNGTKVLIIP